MKYYKATEESTTDVNGAWKPLKPLSEGFEFVGMEQDAEYCKIAEGRINNHVDGTEDTLTEDEKDNSKYTQLNMFE